MALDKFTWENGTQVEPAKVEVEGVSYDVVDAQYEGETPLSAANLNLMQDTLLSNVKDDLTDNTKIPSVKAVKGVILWTNPNPNANFDSQTINLSSSDYDVLEFYYKYSKSINYVLSTKIFKGQDARILSFSSTTSPYIYYRNINYNTDTSYSVGNNTGLYNNDNANNILLYVVGYKTGLF